MKRLGCILLFYSLNTVAQGSVSQHLKISQTLLFCDQIFNSPEIEFSVLDTEKRQQKVLISQWESYLRNIYTNNDLAKLMIQAGTSAGVNFAEALDNAEDPVLFLINALGNCRNLQELELPTE